MNFIRKTISQAAALVLLLVVSFTLAQAQGGAGVRGQITDELGGAIVGATVTLVDASGAEKTATTNEEGIYVFNNVVPGKYTVRVAQAGFAPFENSEVTVAAGQRAQVDIKLSVTIEEQKVNVADDRSLGVESDSNANAHANAKQKQHCKAGRRAARGPEPGALQLVIPRPSGRTRR